MTAQFFFFLLVLLFFLLLADSYFALCSIISLCILVNTQSIGLWKICLSKREGLIRGRNTHENTQRHEQKHINTHGYKQTPLFCPSESVMLPYILSSSVLARSLSRESGQRRCLCSLHPLTQTVLVYPQQPTLCEPPGPQTNESLPEFLLGAAIR